MIGYRTPDAEALLRQIALEEGVDPAVFVSLWEQEGSKSTDPALRGPTLPEGHKYAGHYGQGPFQIMSFHGQAPASFEGQARWAAKHLKERGVRGYYGQTAGGGSARPTGMPTFPSTDEFEAQVMGRARRAGAPDIQLARAGVPDIQPGLLPPASDGFSLNEQPAPAQQLPLSMQERPQMDNPELLGNGSLEALMHNPLFLMGASILANRGNVGRGLLGGTAAWQGMEQSRALADQRRMQAQMLQMKQQEMLRQREVQQQMMQALQGGGGIPGAPGGLAGPGGGVDPSRLINAGVVGTLGGLDNMGNLISAGSAMLPYTGMTQAQQAELADRRARAAYEGVGGPGAAADATGGLSPKGQQEVYQKGAEGLITMDVKRLTDLGEKASGARAMMPSLERMIRTNADVPEGRLAPAQLFAGQVAGSVDSWLGTDFKSWFGGDATIADAEQFFSDSANLIRERIKALGSGTAISNVDLLFTRESVPALLQTKEGRQRMLEAFKADAENLQESYKQADKYFRANKGKGLEGFEPQGLKRAGFLKKYYVVGPNGEKYEMVNEAAAKSVVGARPGFRMVVED